MKKKGLFLSIGALGKSRGASSRCQRMQLVLVLGVLVSFAVVLMATAPGTVFDLDGDSLVNHGLDDWNLLNGNGQGAHPGSAGSSVIRTFVPGSTDVKIFTTGASKDPIDVSNWLWKTATTVPDKDTLTNAYAAEYISGGHTFFVFGADRFAVNGDANIGIWFFQQDVHPTGTGSGGFSGTHVNGDLFLVSAFTGGGGVSTITAYTWDNTCSKADSNTPAVGQCAAANLRKKFASATTSTCNTADEACAVTNGSPITVSWDYESKFGGSANSVPTGGFFEGGVDLSLIFDGNIPCFSSFLMETRSSQEPSSVLKDFLGGGFDTCKVEVSKSCNCTGIVSNGTLYQYTPTGTVHNAGVAPLYNVVVRDDAGTADPATGDDLSFTCDSLAAGQTKTWGGGLTDCTPNSATFTSSSYPVNNVAHVTAYTGANQTGNLKTADTAPVSCSVQSPPNVCTPQRGIAVTKTCSTAVVVLNGDVVVRVDYSGTVQNTGTERLDGVNVTEDNNNDGQVDLLHLTLTGCSSGDGNGTPCTLNPGVTASFSGSYFPNIFGGTGTDGSPSPTGKASFQDKVVGSGTGHLTNTAASDNHTATCYLCPFGVCTQ